MAGNKRQVFVERYLRHWNATKAAEEAGYAHPNTQGPRLLLNVGIKKLIAARMREMRMETDEITVRWTEQARNEGSKFIEADGTVNVAAIVAAGKAHLIKGIKYDARGNRVVEFYDAQTALDRMSKIDGLYKDKETAPQVNIQVDGFEKLLSKIYGDSDSKPND